MMGTKNRGVWLALLAPLWLVACATDPNQDLAAWVAEQRNTVRPKVPPVSEPVPYVPQAYLPAPELSPFSEEKLVRSLREESGSAAISSLLQREMDRRKEPLEAMPLDTMTMVGVLNRAGRIVALVRVNGLLYQVSPGNYLGQNYGRVQQITESRVVLREIVQDAAGEWVERAATLELQEGN